MYFRANVGPTPVVGQVQTREYPGLDLLPGILRNENQAIAELRLDLIEPMTPPEDAVAIDA